MKIYQKFILAHFFISNMVISFSCSSKQPPEVQIHYLGHSSFVLQFDNGVTVVTDYGHENAWVEWGWDSPIHNIGTLIPDVMTYSHQHDDHYDPDRIPQGVSHVLTDMDSLTIKGITIAPVRTCEDDTHVESNTSYLFEYRGFRLCHLGDAQAQIMKIDSANVREKIAELFAEPIDLLMMPIEGKQKFIPQTETFINLLKPQYVVPMHYWSEEYKTAFLNFLKKQNHSGKRYQIIREKNAHFLFTGSSPSDSIRIVTLNRQPF